MAIIFSISTWRNRELTQGALILWNELELDSNESMESNQKQKLFL